MSNLVFSFLHNLILFHFQPLSHFNVIFFCFSFFPTNGCHPLRYPTVKRIFSSQRWKTFSIRMVNLKWRYWKGRNSKKKLSQLLPKKDIKLKKPLGRNIFEFEQFTSTKYLKAMIDWLFKLSENCLLIKVKISIKTY